MERELFVALLRRIDKLAFDPPSKRFRFTDADILLTFLWTVLHDRPVSWACRPLHWPRDLRPARLPTPSTMSRRLRAGAIDALIDTLLCGLRARFPRGTLSIVDGKPLVVSEVSRDPDAASGWGAGRYARGYKLHLICGRYGEVRAWRVTTLNENEHKIAGELVPKARIQGYLLGDRNYDASHLFERCRAAGVQLLAPRRRGAGTGLGHRRHSPARLRSIELLERSESGFGPAVWRARDQIERLFGQLTSAGYGLHGLPAWVRRIHRVRLWVAAKLLVYMTVKTKRKRAA